MSATGEPLLTCDGLLVGYTSAILPPVSLAIRPGELWAVVGPNGAGKSTWMRTALGLEPPRGGRVVVREGTRVAWVPQQAALDPVFPVRARDVVAMGRLGPGRVFGGFGRGDRAACAEALAQVGAADLADEPFSDLSGGQRQRVLIARAVASGANLLFLDEPTTALDRPSEEAVLELVDGLRRRPDSAVALVTHAAGVLRRRADHALLLDRDNELALAGTSAEVVRSEGFVRLFGEASAHEPAGARA